MASKYTNVAVYNRGDFTLSGIQFDGDEIEWAPHEIKHLVMDAAVHCIKKSCFTWDPITNERINILAEVKEGQSLPTSLTWDECHPLQMLDTRNMPATSFDSEGRPLRGEVKNLATPTGMMLGRVPAGASAGLNPNLKLTGAAGPGLGAASAMPSEIADRLDAGTDRLIDQIDRVVPQEDRVINE